MNFKTILLAGAATLALGAFSAQAQLGGGVGGAVGGTVNNAGATAGAATNAAGNVGNNSGAVDNATNVDVDRTESGVGIDASQSTNASGDLTGTDVNTGVNGKVGADANVYGADDAAASAGAAARSTAQGAAMQASDLQSRLEGMGYTNVRTGGEANGNASFIARNKDGKRVDLVVNSSTGAVVSEQVRTH